MKKVIFKSELKYTELNDTELKYTELNDIISNHNQ